MCPIKLRTKPVFQIFHILKINRMLSCNLFIEQPSYMYKLQRPLQCYIWMLSSLHPRCLGPSTQEKNNGNIKTWKTVSTLSLSVYIVVRVCYCNDSW